MGGRLGSLTSILCPRRDDKVKFKEVASTTERLFGEVIVAVTILSGERVELPVMSAHAPFQELKDAVKQQWGMPLVAQRFILAGKLLDADDGMEVGEALAGASEVQTADDSEALEELQDPSAPAASSQPIVVELSVVRAVLPAEVQMRLDRILLQATARGEHERMKEALGEGARVNWIAATSSDPPRSCPEPLMMAFSAGDEVASRILHEAGAIEPDMLPKTSSLGQAFRKSDLLDVVRHLARGSSPNTRLHLGEGIRDTAHGTPLHACCAMHKLEGAAAVVELLCRLGADPDSRDAEGDSPLAHARYFGADEVYDVLKANGAQVQGPYYSTVHIAGRRLLGWR